MADIRKNRTRGKSSKRLCVFKRCATDNSTAKPRATDLAKTQNKDFSFAACDDTPIINRQKYTISDLVEIATQKNYFRVYQFDFINENTGLPTNIEITGVSMSHGEGADFIEDTCFEDYIFLLDNKQIIYIRKDPRTKIGYYYFKDSLDDLEKLAVCSLGSIPKAQEMLEWGFN